MDDVHRFVYALPKTPWKATESTRQQNTDAIAVLDRLANVLHARPFVDVEYAPSKIVLHTWFDDDAPDVAMVTVSNVDRDVCHCLLESDVLLSLPDELTRFAVAHIILALLTFLPELDEGLLRALVTCARQHMDGNKTFDLKLSYWETQCLLHMDASHHTKACAMDHLAGIASCVQLHTAALCLCLQSLSMALSDPEMEKEELCTFARHATFAATTAGRYKVAEDTFSIYAQYATDIDWPLLQWVYKCKRDVDAWVRLKYLVNLRPLALVELKKVVHIPKVFRKQLHTLAGHIDTASWHCAIQRETRTEDLKRRLRNDMRRAFPRGCYAS